MRPMLVAGFIAFGAAVLFAPPLAAGVRVVGLDGFDLGRWTGRGDLSAVDAHCVAVDPRRGGPRFAVAAFGDGPGGAFVLVNGASTLGFTVRYDDGGGARRLRPHRTLDHRRGRPLTPGRGPCDRGARAGPHRLEVRVHERDLAGATAGRFRGRLHLMILAE